LKRRRCWYAALGKEAKRTNNSFADSLLSLPIHILLPSIAGIEVEIFFDPAFGGRKKILERIASRKKSGTGAQMFIIAVSAHAPKK
jgi:hypothetical protein